MGGIKFEKLSYKIRGAFFEVYNTLGPGFKEKIYHAALAKEFKALKNDFQERKRIPVIYKGEKIGIYEPDFIIENKILIEIKAVPFLTRLFDLQLHYYLKGTKYEVGFLVNFGGEKLQIKRRICENPLKPHKKLNADSTYHPSNP